MENRKENRKQLPFKRVSTIFAWNFLLTMPIIVLLTAILYAQNGQIYWGNLVIALFFALLSLVFFLPVLRERRFFGRIAHEPCTQSAEIQVCEIQTQDTQVREVRDLQIVFSGLVRYAGQRAFRIMGKIENASGNEVTVKSPLYAVDKYTVRTYAFQSGSFLNEIRLMAYTAPSLKEGTYYFRILSRK